MSFVARDYKVVLLDMEWLVMSASLTLQNRTSVQTYGSTLLIGKHYASELLLARERHRGAKFASTLLVIADLMSLPRLL